MKKIVTHLVALASAFALAASLPAQDAPLREGDGTDPERPLRYNVVVTAARSPLSEGELGSAVTVITRPRLEALQCATVLDALRSLPELEVVQTGGPGGQASVFLRGAKSEHTLMLLDGVELNDPSTPGRSADLASLSIANVERIEIIRGPQSVLYGSDAMGGVIHIISKSGRGRLNGFVQGEAGSFATFSESVGLSAGSGRVRFSLGATRSDSDGISAARADLGNSEKDGFGATTLSGRLGVEATKNLQADLVLRYVDSRADLDNAGGAGGDDPNNTADAELWTAHAQARLDLFGGRWQQTLGFALGRQERRYENGTDAAHPFDSDRSLYRGRTLRVTWQHQLGFLKAHALVAGIESEREQGESDFHSESAWGPYDSRVEPQSIVTTAFYVQDHVRLAKGWFATLGTRLDDHERFGSKATYRLASSFQVGSSGPRLKASFGTGFKAPSLYQLYSEYGDLDLEPETSSGWDAGIEHSLAGGRLLLGATVFANDFEQMIDFDSVNWKYVNVGAATSSGVELSAAAHVGSAWTLRAAYAYTDTEDEASGEPLLRRARHKANVSAGWRFLQKGGANLELRYVGQRQDMDYSAWPAARVTLDGYLLVNLTLEYEIIRHLRLLAALRNLGDVRYEEISGYGTPGRSFQAGLRYAF